MTTNKGHVTITYNRKLTNATPKHAFAHLGDKEKKLRLHGVANVYIVDYDIKRGRESL